MTKWPANQFNPKKLLNSKWTAVNPVHKERHFIVTQLNQDEEGKVLSVQIEALINHKTYDVLPESLKASCDWLQGWR
ncbi:MAG TPA: TIGR02450 family Trp-rich protein [Thiomicrospira sp.]|nr:TIGR02450 family Trp-rich protein [Thiomicrospira sp.]